MRISTIAVSALVLAMASGASVAGRYVDQHRAMQDQGVESSAAAVVSTGYATGGRGADMLHARQGVATEKAEFAVMDVGDTRSEKDRPFYRGGRAVDYLR